MNKIMLDRCPIDNPSRSQCSKCNNYHHCEERNEGCGVLFYLFIIFFIIIIGGLIVCINFSI